MASGKEGKENRPEIVETNIESSPDILPGAPHSQSSSLFPLQDGINFIPESPPKKRKPVPLEVYAPNEERKASYAYKQKNGWICRVPVKMSPLYDFGLKRCDANPLPKRRRRSKPGELHKDKRFPCPDCKKWYGGDTNHIQRSCRHRYRSETDEELKSVWDIDFPDD